MKSKKNFFVILALITIIILQGVRIIYTFAYEKGDKHSDEIWAYGLANSSTGPHIFQTANGEDELYKDVWVDSSVFSEYIEVSESERFFYSNVINNLKYDTAPPLYCMVLHTVCSFFPNTYSLWYGFWIGFVCFMITQILLWLLAKELFGKNVYSLLVVVLYGFSISALSTVIFVRHYSMLVMLTILFLYSCLKLLKSFERKQFVKWLCITAIALLCGSLTHYFFIVFAFAVCLMYFLWYALHKQIRRLLVFAGVMLTSVLITFPFTSIASAFGLTDSGTNTTDAAGKTLEAGGLSSVFSVFSSFFNIIYDPWFDKNANVTLNCYIRDLFGIDSSVNIPYIIWTLLFLAFFVVLAIVLLSAYVTKKEKPLKDNNWVIKLKNLYSKISNISISKFFIWVCLLAVLLETYVVIGYANADLMQKYTDRYIFLNFPVLCLCIVLLIRKIVGIFVRKSELVRCCIVSAIVIFIILFSNINTKSLYLFPQGETSVDIYKETKNKDVILSMSRHWLMTTYLDYLRDSNRILVTDDSEIFTSVDKISEAKGDEIIIIQDVDTYENVLMRRNNCSRDKITREMVEEKYMPVYEEAFPGKTIEWIGQNVVFLRNVNIYKVY